MLKHLRSSLLTLSLLALTGCASSIVDGEGVRTSTVAYPAVTNSETVEVYFVDNRPAMQYVEVGRVTARAWLLEKGFAALKQEAAKLGATAIVDVKYERRFSVEYLQDLYFINGTAVVWTTEIVK